MLGLLFETYVGAAPTVGGGAGGAGNGAGVDGDPGGDGDLISLSTV
jgi:hypothetical protein